MQFAIHKPQIKNRRFYIKQINITLLVLLILCFSFFSFYQKLTNIIFSPNKIDIFTQDLEDVAFYFRTFDQNLSQAILKIDDIIKSYASWDNIFLTQQTQIDESRTYLRQNKHYLQKLGFSHYETLISFLAQLQQHKEELFSLLWKDETFNYLVILQNTNEKRPNGGFFWSFAFISVANGRLQEFEIIDSYYPDFIAHNTYITPPTRSKPFLPEKEIWFITANKFGFTDMDGKNIKNLYEKMFNQTYVMSKVKQTMKPWLYQKLLHQNIKWVIFVRSDTFEELIPGFTKKIRERQFLNASIDLIRGEYRGNKKELYISQLTEYFNQHKTTIVQNFVNNFDTILDKNYIQIYLSNVSTGFNDFLVNNHLNNTFLDTKIYARDTNTSYNKVDSFVDKNIQITDQNNNIYIDTANDIVPIDQLTSGQYIMNIHYTLNMPSYYANFIAELETKYGISITRRERSILALQPAQYTDDGIPKRRESKSTIYFPPNFSITQIDWEYLEQSQFQTPFANGAYYKIKINTNHLTKSIQIHFEVR